ncbi:hypothetical protein SAMN05216337_1001200 [Bradyrhizobium brasilense]|uniref:Uncharacterized protein n=1 Tax=Bradyrhizobium brasilense TaxID=1419277 RepID=A0A1G6IMU8_9BRAD|nr:hypothetical protein [Bradyrhizobium brasilense]SDC07828.1 hypothetical protein SAMN05216337_1001200 [Bradyrhizobium brasilense]
MSADPDGFFHAHSIEIGLCPNPDCDAIHVHLLDKDGEPRAQMALSCENIEPIVADLRQLRDELMAGAKAKKQ